ncbi:MAG: hypothetical protein GTO41_20045 [Burkholderiales bacterium]|nr:hypothetical protein [Burkholderiales bacterium]
MLVRMLTDVAGLLEYYQQDKTYEVDNKLAKRWIDRDIAEPAQIVPAVEAATKDHKPAKRAKAK